MSLQWTLITGFLYVEIAIILLLVLPIASPRKWNSLLKSEFLQGLQEHAGIYFSVLLTILILVFVNAIRNMKNLESEQPDHTHLDPEMQVSMQLFGATRNFYVSGFALFLSLVIRHLVTVISAQAESDVSVRQVQSREVTTLKTKITELEDELKLEKKGKTALKTKITELEDELKLEKKGKATLKTKITKLEDELDLEKKEKTAVKQQAKNLAEKYDRLANEYSTLQGHFSEAICAMDSAY